MKKIKLIMIFINICLSFLVHFMYNWFPSTFTSIFFPVNESIWEHMKIIYTCLLISSIIEYIIYKKKKINVNNFYINIPIISILGIITYLILYLPLDKIFSHNLILAIIILFIVFTLSEIMSYYILKFKKIKNEKIIGIFLIILSYIIFTYLTYNPIKNNLFLDRQTNTYGIKKD